MEGDHVTHTGSVTWTRTREALAHFRTLLLCSKCSSLTREPVCLGLCEHLFCRACAGPQAGEGCSVCHSPAWVKDIQINRQLSNITELFCNLDSLLNPHDASSTPTDAVQSEVPSDSKNKNYKIWFSPRSRKVRCTVEKPVVANMSNGDQQKKPATLPSSRPKDLSVFNFTSSSQDSSSSTPPRGKVKKKNKFKRVRPTCKQDCGSKKPVTRSRMKQEFKRLKLEAINQQWGFGKEDTSESKDEEGEKMSFGDDDRKSGKKVSFQCPGSKHEEPQKMFQQAENEVLSFDKNVLNNQGFENTQPGCEKQNVSDHDQPKSDKNSVGSPSRTLNRAAEDQDRDDPQRTPKRPRSTSRCRKRLSREETASQATPRSHPDASHNLRSSEEEQNTKPVFSPSGRRRSPATPALVRRSPGVRNHQASPAYMKRNHKGETPLHLAAIKGDVKVQKLLAEGADPNLKDNAGWTPLHEACNQGHLEVAEELMQQGALLDTPGYQNDSPLHDAVRNGHVAVVKLLVERGASQSVLNMFGLRPVDYALTPEMQDVLRLAPEASHPIPTSQSPAEASGYVRETGPMVLLGCQLTRAQKKQLDKAAHRFGGKQVESFSAAVTHVVVPDACEVSSALTALLAVLHGCWLLRFNWVCCSVQADRWVEESVYATGPPRARLNRDRLLPPLFDGCFFYLMGSFQKPPKDQLLQLIREGGGRLLSRQPKPESDVTQTLSAAAYHAQPGSDQALCTQYILYDPQSSYKPTKVRVGKVWSAPSSWLLQSIAAFRLLPVPEP